MRQLIGLRESSDEVAATKAKPQRANIQFVKFALDETKLSTKSLVPSYLQIELLPALPLYEVQKEISNIGFPEHYFNFAAYNELSARATARNPILTGLHLLETSATHYYLNPNIPETYQIRQLYPQLPPMGPILNINHQQEEDPERERFRSRFPLATLLQIDPQNYQLPSLLSAHNGVRITKSAPYVERSSFQALKIRLLRSISIESSDGMQALLFGARNATLDENMGVPLA
ncbi:hypothetical protein Tco_0250905 [Tanacetum coccineum]